MSRLPSLLKLRNALYSSDFRTYLASVTSSGPLSGQKTDMAINVYTPGCHLLCHDDVIGSRRLSYILYLTDPDKPWKAEWGGALRLYPTKIVKGADGKELRTPSPDFSVSIPPAFNQLSFFAVQPGESFHDVEEVYEKGRDVGEDDDSVRVRMAISGWYHIPQESEEGYEEGLEEKLAEKSSLVQLQGKGDELDWPRSRMENYEVPHNASSQDDTRDADDEEVLTQTDLDFLLNYLAPTYLTPDTLEELSEIFAEESCLRLENFLSQVFAKELRAHVVDEEKDEALNTLSSRDIDQSTLWKVARPPHKHRFLYQQRREGTNKVPHTTTFSAIVEDLLPSNAFSKWLSLATGVHVNNHNVLARRFRRGQDYTLATGIEDRGRQRLEVTLGITPTPGWGDDDDDDDGKESKQHQNGSNGTATQDDQGSQAGGVGGYEVYMAGDDDDDDDDASETSQVVGSVGQPIKKPHNSKADPAVYRSKGDDEDDAVLFSMEAGWNRLSIVLRDQDVLKFVKYVSQAAPGDRWDYVGEYGVTAEDDEQEENEGS